MHHPLGPLGDVVFMGHQQDGHPLLAMQFIEQIKHFIGGA